MEARLTDPICEASLQSLKVDLGVEGQDITAAPAASSQPQSRLLARIDRYLLAAGAKEPALRARIAAAAARDLLAQGLSAEANWAEIVAAIDRSLATELSPEGVSLPRARGRVALGLVGSLEGDRQLPPASLCGPEWSTPPRRHQAMRGQDLSRWRPSLQRLLQIQLSRPAQGVAACLCWLAVLFIP